MRLQIVPEIVSQHILKPFYTRHIVSHRNQIAPSTTAPHLNDQTTTQQPRKNNAAARQPSPRHTHCRNISKKASPHTFQKNNHTSPNAISKTPLFKATTSTGVRASFVLPLPSCRKRIVRNFRQQRPCHQAHTMAFPYQRKRNTWPPELPRLLLPQHLTSPVSSNAQP